MWKRRMTVRYIPFLVLYRKKKKTQRAETKGGKRVGRAMKFSTISLQVHALISSWNCAYSILLKRALTCNSRRFLNVWKDTTLLLIWLRGRSVLWCPGDLSSKTPLFVIWKDLKVPLKRERRVNLLGNVTDATFYWTIFSLITTIKKRPKFLVWCSYASIYTKLL